MPNTTTRRRFALAAPQQLISAGINSAVTSVQVPSFAGWPTQFPFYAALELGAAGLEVVSVTNIVGTTATIVRAQRGTAAIAHPLGATLDAVAVDQDYDEANLHSSSTSGLHGVSGNVVGDTDVQTLTNKTLSSPVTTGTISGANETLSGTLSVTGTSTLGAINSAGAVSLTGAGTALAVTNNVTVGGNVTVTGALFGASFTGAVVFKSFTNEAAAGVSPVGTALYLTAPTGAGYTAGLFESLGGGTWVPQQRNHDGFANLEVAPAYTTPTTASDTSITLGNVTVPAWASKAQVSWSINGIVTSAAEPQVSAQLKIGTAGGPARTVHGPATATGRFSVAYNHSLTSVPTGTQSVTILCHWSGGGTNTFAIDAANSNISANITFLP